MFKVNNKDTRMTPSCSSVSIVNFEQVNADWVEMIKEKTEFEAQYYEKTQIDTSKILWTPKI